MPADVAPTLSQYEGLQQDFAQHTTKERYHPLMEEAQEHVHKQAVTLVTELP